MYFQPRCFQQDVVAMATLTMTSP